MIGHFPRWRQLGSPAMRRGETCRTEQGAHFGMDAGDRITSPLPMMRLRSPVSVAGRTPGVWHGP